MEQSTTDFMHITSMWRLAWIGAVFYAMLLMMEGHAVGAPSIGNSTAAVGNRISVFSLQELCSILRPIRICNQIGSDDTPLYVYLQYQNLVGWRSSSICFVGRQSHTPSLGLRRRCSNMHFTTCGSTTESWLVGLSTKAYRFGLASLLQCLWAVVWQKTEHRSFDRMCYHKCRVLRVCTLKGYLNTILALWLCCIQTSTIQAWQIMSVSRWSTMHTYSRKCLANTRCIDGNGNEKQRTICSQRSSTN